MRTDFRGIEKSVTYTYSTHRAPNASRISLSRHLRERCTLLSLYTHALAIRRSLCLSLVTAPLLLRRRCAYRYQLIGCLFFAADIFYVTRAHRTIDTFPSHRVYTYIYLSRTRKFRTECNAQLATGIPRRYV